MSWGVVAAVGASVVGGAIASNGAQSAANTQADAANNAANLTRDQWNQTQANLRPFLQLGTSAINPLLQAMGFRMSPGAGQMQTREQIYQSLLPQYTHTSQGINFANGIPGFAISGGGDAGMSYDLGALERALTSGNSSVVDYNGLNAAVDEAMQRQQENSLGNWEIDPNNILNQTFKAPTLEEAQQTPGYQFALQQGLKAVQNSASARGLGASGAAMRGAADYSTGLADSTYNNVFSRALSTFNTNYGSAANRVNRLWSLVGSGQNAAATTGQLGASAMNSIGDAMMGGANAAAAGQVGSSNAISGALGSIGNSFMLNQLLSGRSGSTSMYGQWGNSLPGLGVGD